ncbi:MAG: hypothetical protein F6J93_09060 [Oscillatoria sp. SIO1A7]|nr:hypothetical protein [Oscillatoria sp. SIO1A7]
MGHGSFKGPVKGQGRWHRDGIGHRETESTALFLFICSPGSHVPMSP